MSKILVVADIHIHAYPSKNPVADYRLHQGSRIVSENIIEAGKKNDCDYIIFAGDIIEKSINRPYVQAEIKYFLDRIMSDFKEGWIIWGNHDQDNKSSIQTQFDSVLGVLLPYNLHYAHQTTMILDNTLIGFSNWQPEFDLSWIQNKVDVLFTHARINYDAKNNNFLSQQLDESKFDLAICGDIHQPAQLGKYVSIGVPQRCKMGDSEISSGIVFDTINKKYEWINLNPRNNLMKFEYTSDLSKDNVWDQTTGTWYVYKRPNNAVVAGSNVAIPAWEEIDGLINQAIIANNLQAIHSEVLTCSQNKESEEVDFNFTLLKFSCKNWRSIEDCTLYFNEGDKILIQGSNGSGKSSLLSALKYAFVDTSDTKGLSSLKSFIQFGTKDCWTEVEFLYQGSKCRIRRGSKEYGLWINDIQQKYSDKRSFEADVRIRFPFIKYMDIFFLDADHNQLIGGMSVEEKSLVISKFLKLDKLDLFNEIAINLLDQVKKSGSEWIVKSEELNKVLNFIDSKLNDLILPSISKQDLLKSKEDGLILQKKSEVWNNYIRQSTGFQSRIDLALENIKRLEEEKSKFREIPTIDNDISNCNSEIQSLQSQIVELGNIKTTIDFKTKEYNNLREEGNKAYREAQNINLNQKCPTCGQVILTADSLQAHKNELENKVNEIKLKITPLADELNKLTETWNNSETYYNQINNKIKELNNAISRLTLEKQNQVNVVKQIQNETDTYNQNKENLLKLGTPERVELPVDFMQKMSEIETNLSNWNNWESLTYDKTQKINELNAYKNEIDKLTATANQLELYINLTGPTGDIYNVILHKLADQFSDGQVRYEVRKFNTRGRGGEHLDLESQFFNNGNWVDYEACSSGQKTVLDINFLQKIVTRMGLLVMDEFLKHLDPENHDNCIEIISNLNIGCVMISSHMESIAAFNNKSCKLSLTPSGLTEIDYK